MEIIEHKCPTGQTLESLSYGQVFCCQNLMGQTIVAVKLQAGHDRVVKIRLLDSIATEPARALDPELIVNPIKITELHYHKI